MSLLVVTMMMRHVCSKEWSLRKQKEASLCTAFISIYNEPSGEELQRSAGDMRARSGAEEEDESPHARPTAVRQYTVTRTLMSARK